MKHLWLAGLLLSSALIAKPGDHAGIFNHFDEDVTGGQRIENPNGLPEDEASRQRRYYREWGAYNKMINLYLADHPTFVILPPPPFEPEDPAKPTAEEKAAHEAQVLAQKNQRDVLTSPDPVKAIEQTVKFSVDNAVAVFKKRNPNATAVQIEAYRKKAAEGYRQQFSMLYRRAMADITLRIKFGDLHAEKSDERQQGEPRELRGGSGRAKGVSLRSGDSDRGPDGDRGVGRQAGLPRTFIDERSQVHAGAMGLGHGGEGGRGSARESAE